MWDIVSSLPNLDLSKIVLSVGALGTAAYGVVDASKGFGGGVSNRGFGDIRRVIAQFVAKPGAPNENLGALSLASILTTLRANWLNGMALGDQKAVAKALIKLNLTSGTAQAMAAAAGVDGNLLTNVATKLSTGAPLTQAETDVYGRFDLLLSAMLDQGYQRGDQRYRNSAKLLSIPVAVCLALLGASCISKAPLTQADEWRAVIAGLIATPLAPIAKDLASAIQAGTKLAQLWK